MALLFCEVYARALLPTLRALIAKELVDNYGFSQWSAAKVLGITQPLINYYLSGKRGSKLMKALSSSEDVRRYVELIAKSIAEGRFEGRSFCELCISLRTTKSELLKGLGINVGEVTFPRCN